MSSTRLRRLRALGWVLLASALACSTGVGWWLASGDPAGEDSVVLDVETAIASLPPATIAPLPVTQSPPFPPPATSKPVVSTPSATLPPSPLVSLLGEPGSAIPAPSHPPVRPSGLIIADLGLDRPIRDVGVEDDGELEVPDETEIGWYRYGASPGTPGATVLAAHVSWNRTLGPFARLGELEPGQRVEVVLDDGGSRIYEVIERAMYDKDALPPERIWRTTGPETLVLITCGGDFNPEIRRYRQNIVVYAVPVEQTGLGRDGTR